MTGILAAGARVATGSVAGTLMARLKQDAEKLVAPQKAHLGR
jgi:hypothetical protein